MKQVVLKQGEAGIWRKRRTMDNLAEEHRKSARRRSLPAAKAAEFYELEI